MLFTPQKYLLPDLPIQPFIDENELWNLINSTKSSIDEVEKIIAKSLSKQRLNLSEVAVLINANDQESIKAIKKGAQDLKNKIYGNRIVLFAPLYIGNKCQNDCSYCGFRVTNKKAERKTLNDQEIINEIEALVDNGQKRLVLVYGEHQEYSPEYIANTVKIAYSVKKGKGEIRRVNINAAPMDIEGFKVVKEAGIGTFQIFQETYHPATYKKYHLGGKKKDFENRLTALDKAQEAGLDDVGIGVLFGLYDWRYEVLALVRHTNHLEACYNIGPHTISFPRITESSSVNLDTKYVVSDEDFAKLIAILRLAVPYTGMILTARENATLRNELIQYGVSQIDGGTKIELGAYSNLQNENQNLNKEQFRINDERSLSEVINELIDHEMLPSFCTACYRVGRTGEHFMEFSVPGFIKKFCTPNAILTLAEYLEDYADEKTAEKGRKVIQKNIDAISNEKLKKSLLARIEKVKLGERDLNY